MVGRYPTSTYLPTYLPTYLEEEFEFLAVEAVLMAMVGNLQNRLHYPTYLTNLPTYLPN